MRSVAIAFMETVETLLSRGTLGSFTRAFTCARVKFKLEKRVVAAVEEVDVAAGPPTLAIVLLIAAAAMTLEAASDSLSAPRDMDVDALVAAVKPEVLEYASPCVRPMEVTALRTVSMRPVAMRGVRQVSPPSLPLAALLQLRRLETTERREETS